MTTSHEQALQAAQLAREAAIPRAQADPARPHCHFTAPAGWMNDPNGTIFHDDTYHLFYQHHPYSDDWGPMCWGHARSHDLLNWEHLPIALAPKGDGVENGVWSGCVAINKLGQPIAYYTCANYPGSKPEEADFTQNAALGSDDLLVWKKFEGNPLMTRALHGPNFRADWRDPFIFHEDGRTFMVVGMTGKGTPIYEATDEAFLEWQYRGILCDIDAECPNFFKVNGKWLYLSSPFDNVTYAIGEFDIEQYRFTIQQNGRYDWSEFGHSDYYATNHLYDKDGRSILFGWIRGWEPGHGWNGCMGIPRQVIIDPDGTLRTPPIEEFSSQRRNELSIPSKKVGIHPYQPEFPHENQYEIRCKFVLGKVNSMGIGLRCPGMGQPKSAVWLEKDGIHLDGIHIPLTEKEMQQPVDVHLFVDHSVAELFINNGKYCAVRVFKDFNPEDRGIRLFADGGEARFEDFHLWTVVAITP